MLKLGLGHGLLLWICSWRRGQTLPSGMGQSQTGYWRNERGAKMEKWSVQSGKGWQLPEFCARICLQTRRKMPKSLAEFYGENGRRVEREDAVS